VSVEVEVTTPREALEALKAGADIIMLDNMQVNEMRQVVNAVNGKVRLEASGGITLDNVHQVAMTGVDMISIGLTHSVKSLISAWNLNHRPSGSLNPSLKLPFICSYRGCQ
jgi:nicotinate-nucleotide pyrophosphorylase (carboxylating)